MMFGIKGKLYQPHLLQGTAKTPMSRHWCHTGHVAWQGADGVPEFQGLCFGVSLFRYSHVLGSGAEWCTGVSEHGGTCEAEYLWAGVAVYWGNCMLGYPCEDAGLCWDACV